MTEEYFNDPQITGSKKCARGHEKVELKYAGTRKEFGGVEVYECPQCGRRYAFKMYADHGQWHPSLFSEDDDVVSVEEIEDGSRTTYRVHTGHPGEHVDCRTRQQAEDLAAVAVLTGFKQSSAGSSGIPPSVAGAGQAETVVYALANPDNDIASAETLAQAWGLDHETVRSHIRDVRSRASELR